MDKIFGLDVIYSFFDKRGYKLKDEELKKLCSIFWSVDTHDLSGNVKKPIATNMGVDNILNKNEYETFKTKLLNWGNRYSEIFKELFKEFESTKTSKIEILANNILKLTNSFDRIEVEKYFLKYINSDNLLQVLDEFYKQDSHGAFFESMSFTQYNKTENYSALETKFKEFASLLIDYAKSNNIYTKDYEKRISEDFEKENSTDLGTAMDRLYTRIALHLNKKSEATVNNRKMELIEPNGKIDANFAQGSTGDCFLLSVIRAGANNEQGLEKLNNMITVNKNSDGNIISVSVNIQDKSYEIDYEELKNANEYATGDLDVRALEIATNRYSIEYFGTDISDGASTEVGFKLLFGENNVKIQEFKTVDDKYLEALLTNNQMSTLCTNEPLMACDDNEKEITIPSHHALTSIAIEDNYVVFYDPWNSGKRLRIDKNILKNSDSQGCIVQWNNT